jgi:hypothetical protein
MEEAPKSGKISYSASRARAPPEPPFCPCGLDTGVLHHAKFFILPHYHRFIKILDSVLHHLVPAWDHTLGTFSEIKVSLGLQYLRGIGLLA